MRRSIRRVAVGVVLSAVAVLAPVALGPVPLPAPAWAAAPAPPLTGCLASAPFNLSTCAVPHKINGGYGNITTVVPLTVRVGNTTTMSFPSGITDFDTPITCGDLGCIYPGISWQWPSDAYYSVVSGCGGRDDSCTIKVTKSGLGYADSGEGYIPVYAQANTGPKAGKGTAFAIYVPPEAYHVVNFLRDSSNKPLGTQSVASYAVRSGSNPNVSDCVSYDAALFVVTQGVPAPDCVLLNNSGWRETPGGPVVGATTGYLRVDSGPWTIKTFPTAPIGSVNIAKATFTEPQVVLGFDDQTAISTAKPAPILGVTITPVKTSLKVGESSTATIKVSAKGTGAPLTEVKFSSDTIAYSGPALTITGTKQTPFVLGAGVDKTFSVTYKGAQGTSPNSPVQLSVSVAGKNEFGVGVAAAAQASITVIAPPSPAPFTTFTAMVNRQYADLCKTKPTSAQLTTWLAGLDGGTKTLKDLVDSLRTCHDQVTNVDPVMRLYRAYFLRIPDYSGVNYWIGKRRAGTSLDAISGSFAGSAEFKKRYGALTNQQFVNLVYTNVLGRPGEGSGLAYWTSQLDQKKRTHGTVMTGFSESAEYKKKQATATAFSAMYLVMLGRAPSQAEYDYFVPLFATKTAGDIAAFLATTDAYKARL